LRGRSDSQHLHNHQHNELMRDFGFVSHHLQIITTTTAIRKSPESIVPFRW
jgi:hypothetical protein